MKDPMTQRNVTALSTSINWFFPDAKTCWLCYSPPGKQRVCQRAAGSEHQGSDGRSGGAPRFAHPGSGGGAAETRGGAGCSSGGETQLDGTRGAHGVHPGAAERNGPAVLRAGFSPDP